MKSEKINDLHRSLLLVTGDPLCVSNAIKAAIGDIRHDYLIVSNNLSAYDGMNLVTYKQARSLLGQEKSLVVFDVYDGIHPDALAAITGLIVGGGSLILCLPSVEEWDSVFGSEFSKRFVGFLRTASFAKLIDANDESNAEIIRNSVKEVEKRAEFELTSDQKTVIEKITLLAETDTKQALVVVSDRGRGKSTSLGIVAAKLLQRHRIKILITAPRFKACEVAFSALQKSIEGVEIKQAGVQYQASSFQFMAPDEILRSDVDADLLLIDEAASIPVPILKQLLNRFDKTVYVSTVHGYEGTGRGFSVRFTKELNDSVYQWQQIEMKTPVRWGDNDPLEAWLFKFLCLDADVADINNDVQIDDLKVRQISRNDLAKNESLLRQVFSLLVLAHYKTRPSDLQRILDDEMVITIAEFDDRVVAVLLSANEGEFDQEMSTAIFQGVRRPKGNLLAQTLTYHCGVENAACALSHRIMRVVVHPQCQHQGIGSLLLESLSNSLKKQEIDILGASFGLTKELAKFWEKNKFEIVRVGLKKEQSSGEHAAVYVQPFSEVGNFIVNKALQRFESHFPLLRATVLSEIETGFIVMPLSDLTEPLSETEWEDIESFVNYSRSYELCVGGVDKWVRLNLTALNDEDDIFRSVLKNVVFEKMDWKEVVKNMSLDGKKQAQALFKQAVIYLWDKINNVTV